LSLPAYSMILEAYCQNRLSILVFAAKLSEARLAWQAAPGTRLIDFFPWHFGRWADHLQANIPGKFKNWL
jgi:hypothetical protein